MYGPKRFVGSGSCVRCTALLEQEAACLSESLGIALKGTPSGHSRPPVPPRHGEEVPPAHSKARHTSTWLGPRARGPAPHLFRRISAAATTRRDPDHAQNANARTQNANATPPINPEADRWRTCPYQRASALPSPNWLDSAACGSTPPKRGNQPLPLPGAGVQLDTGRDPRVHVKRERAGHLAVPGSPPVRRYGPPQPPLQPFSLCRTC